MARFDVIEFNDFRALKRVAVVWRGVSDAGAHLLVRRLPHVTFTNPSGPTEATIAPLTIAESPWAYGG